ncbi:MAG: HK97 gp10 family phage protein [Firmicutes bacterium]|nr:HK97 gp10 family phage protein [Bacillota bacterium]
MGDFQLKWYGPKAKALARQAAIFALCACAADLQGKSAMQAPIDTGDLKANCLVSPLRQEGSQVSLTVGYDLPYAIVQHEHVEFRHPKGGKAKYLEDPFKENAKKYVKYIRDTVKQALRSG